MTRYIDADACIDYIRNNNQHAWEALAYAPTIDAVEVVRCKECRKQGSDDCPMFSREWRVIMRGNECVDDFVFHDLTEPSGFCSYGERKTE